MKFSDWLLNKILTNLSSKEGFQEIEKSNSLDIKAIVQDIFGHRYEISVKLLSRMEGHAINEILYQNIDVNYNKTKTDEKT